MLHTEHLISYAISYTCMILANDIIAQHMKLYEIYYITMKQGSMSISPRDRHPSSQLSTWPGENISFSQPITNFALSMSL